MEGNNLMKSSYATEADLYWIRSSPWRFLLDKDLFQSFVNMNKAFKEKVEQASI
jgi:hypothetical protein